MTMPAMPNVTGGAAGPSGAADSGNTTGLGAQTVGDYYATGSRVRKSEGWAWKELAVLGAVAALGFVVWRKL